MWQKPNNIQHTNGNTAMESVSSQLLTSLAFTSCCLDWRIASILTMVLCCKVALFHYLAIGSRRRKFGLFTLSCGEIFTKFGAELVVSTTRKVHLSRNGILHNGRKASVSCFFTRCVIFAACGSNALTPVTFRSPTGRVIEIWTKSNTLVSSTLTVFLRPGHNNPNNHNGEKNKATHR